MTTLIVLFFVAVGLYGIVIHKQFGKVPAGERLALIKQVPSYRDGAFQNLSPTPVMLPGKSVLDLASEYFKPAINRKPDHTLPSVRTDLRTLPDDAPTLVWFGHSSYLIKIAGRTILVDPVFSGHASPVVFFGKNYPGSNVYAVEDLPDIDVLLLTHDHYDHLDYDTIVKLKSSVGRVVTSLGVGAHLESWGYDSETIAEIAWHETTTVAEGLQFTALPARHFSGRLLKRGQTLWSSFVLQTLKYKLYLGGDSGYDTHFKEIGETYGPFDLAILECGQYGTNWPFIHMLPEQTAQAALDLGAKELLPVHWAKFTLALHPWTEPIERVTVRAQEVNLTLITPMIGEPFQIGKSFVSKPWWRQSAPRK